LHGLVKLFVCDSGTAVFDLLADVVDMEMHLLGDWNRTAIENSFELVHMLEKSLLKSNGMKDTG